VNNATKLLAHKDFLIWPPVNWFWVKTSGCEQILQSMMSLNAQDLLVENRYPNSKEVAQSIHAYIVPSTQGFFTLRSVSNSVIAGGLLEVD
jgi:hypothetical protein